jgi:hypothetical protein
VGRERILDEVATQVADLVQRLDRLFVHRTGLTDNVVRSVKWRAEQLEDPAQAFEAAQAIMGTLYPYEDPPRTFWASETGQSCARALGYHREVAPFMQAAWILNVSRQRVYQLCDLERLIRVDSPREGVAPQSLRYELWTHGRRPARR